jgi:hypothetical protein
MDLPTRHAIPQLNASPAPATDAPAQTARSAPAATAGAPPAFGTATPAGPSIEPSDFEHAEKLMQVSMTPAERGQAAGNWSISMASLVERRTGPRKVPLEHSLAPASVWKPLLSGLPKYPVPVSKSEDVQTYSKVTDSLPLDDVSIAYSPVTHLSHWIATRQITSERLCSIYLDRLKRYDPLLRCVITLTEEHAMGRLGLPTGRLPQAATLGFFTVSRTAQRIFWIRQESPLPMARSPTAIECRRWTVQSSTS